jgi:lipopolysaccharide heptosyltransferase II
MMPQAWDDVRRALCVRLDTVGDVLMTSPAIRALKESAPYRSISVLTSSRGAEAAALLPDVDDVLVYDPPWMKATPSRSGPHQDRQVIEKLAGLGFDAAVVFTVFSQNPLPAAFLCYMAGIPRRLAHSRENPYQLLTNWVPEPEPEKLVRHEVRRQLDLVGAVGCSTSDERLSITIPEAAIERAKSELEQAGIDTSREWVVVHPGASASSRRYPREGFARFASAMVQDLSWQVVFTGSAGESELVEAIRQEMTAPAASLAGRLSLSEVAALLSVARLLVANNTGPVHVAAAAGTPVVVLYALTNPQHAPWGVPSRVLYHDVPCRFCYRSVCPEGHHNCLRMVRPDQIVEAARDLLEETRTPRTTTAATPINGRVDGQPIPLPVRPFAP